ncbi:hypothetical protein EPO04_03215 [Patescibacteria group bacterium]|nr:MAG: hypothetical protein EPO04_03215 [Patescibacteria group bacterium]
MRRFIASLHIVFLALIFSAPVAVTVAPAAHATTESEICNGANIGGGNSCSGSPGTSDDSLKKTFRTASNVLLYLVGAIAVIALIYGGFRYVASTGNSAQIEAAKHTIIYAITGLVVAILAYAIVNFIISRIG